jgi:hypothetical protein
MSNSQTIVAEIDNRFCRGLQFSSIRKSFKFKERVSLRVAVDVFKVLNNQGLNPPGTNAIAA